MDADNIERLMERGKELCTEAHEQVEEARRVCSHLDQQRELEALSHAAHTGWRAHRTTLRDAPGG